MRVDAADFSDAAAEAEIGWVVDLVTAIRSVRAEMNIPPATLTPLVLAGASAETKERAQRWSDVVKRMARLADISFADRAPEGAVQLLVRGEVAALPLKGVIDLSAEKARLDKEMAKADADIKRVDAKLANEKFVANAPEEIVEEEKEKREAARGAQGQNPRGAGAAAGHATIVIIERSAERSWRCDATAQPDGARGARPHTDRAISIPDARWRRRHLHAIRRSSVEASLDGHETVARHSMLSTRSARRRQRSRRAGREAPRLSRRAAGSFRAIDAGCRDRVLPRGAASVRS